MSCVIFSIIVGLVAATYMTVCHKKEIIIKLSLWRKTAEMHQRKKNILRICRDLTLKCVKNDGNQKPNCGFKGHATLIL